MVAELSSLPSRGREWQVFLFEQNIIFSEAVGKKTQFTNPAYIYKAHIQVINSHIFRIWSKLTRVWHYWFKENNHSVQKKTDPHYFNTWVGAKLVVAMQHYLINQREKNNQM